MKSTSSVRPTADVSDPGAKYGLDWQHAGTVVKEAPSWPEKRVEKGGEAWDILLAYCTDEDFLNSLTPEQRYELLINHCTPGPEYRMSTPFWAQSTDYFGVEWDGTGSCSHCLVISAASDSFCVSIHRHDTIHPDGTVDTGEPYLWAEAPSAAISPEDAVRFSQALKSGAVWFEQLKTAGE